MTMTHGEGHGEGGHILEEVDRGLEDHSESHLESFFHDDDDDDDDDDEPELQPTWGCPSRTSGCAGSSRLERWVVVCQIRY